MTNDELAIDFKGRHDAITPRMQDHAAKKLARLQRYNRRVARIEVVADHAHAEPEVELIVHMRRGKPLVARQRSESFASAIDLLVEKMEKQLKKQKEKRTNHKSSGDRPAGDKAARRARGGSPREETYEDVVRRSLRG